MPDHPNCSAAKSTRPWKICETGHYSFPPKILGEQRKKREDNSQNGKGKYRVLREREV